MPEFASNFEMRKQGFVYEAGDMASASMQDIPNNRTLFVGDLSGKPATKPELNYELETLEDVFAHYKPEVKVEYAVKYQNITALLIEAIKELTTTVNKLEHDNTELRSRITTLEGQ